MYQIQPLRPEEFHLCNNIWSLDRYYELAEIIFDELVSGKRVTFVCVEDGAFVGEVSLVWDMEDREYTIPKQRVCLSRLMVKFSWRRQGVGTALVYHMFQYAKELGYTEMSVGVDLNNYAAIRLYAQLGFDRIIRADEDDQGEYLKLLKYL